MPNVLPNDAAANEPNLDPRDWGVFRKLAKRMTDDMLDRLEHVRDQPVWQPVPSSTRDALAEAVPFKGQSLESVYETFLEHIAPYPTGNIHPRFWGWVMGTGTPTGVLAEMLAAGMNSHVAGYDQAATIIEQQVCRWLIELLKFPESSSSLLVSGGTAANLNGLTSGVVAKAGFDIRAEGAHGGPRLTVYGSTQTHSWAIKACETLGLGRKAFRAIAVDGDHCIDVEACRAQIAADLGEGFRPVCIVGNVGTVNVGAIDDLKKLRALADEFGLWLHIDGAFGSLAVLSDARSLVDGQESADSIAFDLHKWGYMPYEVGVVITRDGDAQTKAYRSAAAGGAPSYLRSSNRGMSVNTTYFADRGLQLSRGFRALKVWMSMKEQGVDRIGEAIGRNIQQAKRLGSLVDAHPKLERVAPIPLNIVCFRYQTEATEDHLNALNEEILVELQMRGIAVPSQTVLDGMFAIRVCITNHRSTDSDFDLLIEAVASIGEELSAGFSRQEGELPSI